MNAYPMLAGALAVAASILFAAGSIELTRAGPRLRIPHLATVPISRETPSRRSFPRWTKVALLGALGLPLLAIPFPFPLLAVAIGVLVLRFRHLITGRAARKRLAAVDAEIPQLLDLLAAGSSAGLAAPLALRRAADGLRGPLAAEVRATTEAVDLGARWRDELAAMTQRLDLPDLRRAVSVLTRTETLGSSLEEATSELAASVRHARRAAVTERARAAPVKMLFPLVFLVLPAFLLLTVVPVLLTTVQSIR